MKAHQVSTQLQHNILLIFEDGPNPHALHQPQEVVEEDPGPAEELQQGRRHLGALLPLLHTILEGVEQEFGHKARQAGDLARPEAVIGAGLQHNGIRVVQQSGGHRHQGDFVQFFGPRKNIAVKELKKINA